MFRVSLVIIAAVVLFSGCSGGGGGNDGVISFTAAAFSQNEDGTATGLEITLQRVGGSGDVGVTLFPTSGSATSGVDFDGTPILVTWLAGDLSNKTVTVPVIDDNIDEQPGETVNLEIANPTGGASLGAQTTATLTIVDDDEAGSLQFALGNYSLGEDGTVLTEDITVLRVGGTDGQVSVTVTSVDAGINNVANSDPDSHVEPVDYNAINVVVTFNDGDDTPQTVLVGSSIVQDLLPERTERFQLHLSDPTGGAELGALTVAQVAILDDDDLLRIADPASVNSGWLLGSSVVKLGRNLLIGAPRSPHVNTGFGRVYLYDPAFGQLLDTILPEPGVTRFGTSLAVFGNTLAIGGEGTVSLYDLDPLTLGWTLRLVIDSAAQGFGSVLLGLSDGRLAVGAPLAQIDGSTEPSGAVFFHDPYTGGLLDELWGTGADRFGTSLTPLPGHLVVGAPGAGGGDGAIHVFTLATLDLVGFLAPPFAGWPFGSPLGFGYAAAAHDEGLLVGAPGQPPDGPTGAGIFAFLLGQPLDVLGIQSFYFGFNVFVHGPTCRIVGAGFGSNGGVPVFQGELFVWGTDLSPISLIPCPDAAPMSLFGSVMLDFDGVLVVSAPRGVTALTDYGDGVVYVMKLP